SPVTSSPITADFTPGVPVIVSLTVTNASGADVVSPGGRTITDVMGTTTCTLETGDITVPASGSAMQQCDTAMQHVSATSWNDTSYDPLTYSGDSADGGSAPVWSVPANCGDSTGLLASARATLLTQLGSATPAGTVVFWGPTYNVSAGSVTCSPSA